MKLLYILTLVTVLVSADYTSDRANALNLTRTWVAPMPNSPTVSASFIKSNWHTSNIHGSDDISFIQDPIDASSNSIVMKVDYPAGSYAPKGTKNGRPFGGAEFFLSPNGKKEYNTALLSYDVAFASNFDFVKGGKLLGVYGGNTGTGCSGGEEATGDSCFSVRMMWRSKGEGEAYAYVPTTKALCDQKNIICHGRFGTSINRGSFTFPIMQWSRIEMLVKMNSDNNTNGILKIWQDNNLVIDRDIKYRTNQSLGVSSLMFSTFFGGGSTDYATLVDTSSYFRNLKLSTGDTPITNIGTEPDNNDNSGSNSLHPSSVYFISIVIMLYPFLF